jgi:hypothetical protein
MKTSGVERPSRVMAALERWCRVTVVGGGGAVLAAGVIEGTGAPDLGAVDEVARLALLAARSGATMTIADVSPAMAELLELAGLRVQVEGQAEGREEPLGVEEVQEEVHPGDLPA